MKLITYQIPKAQRTKIANEIIDQADRAWLLSGTPMTSRPINYYNLLKLVESRVSTLIGLVMLLDIVMVNNLEVPVVEKYGM